MSQLINQSRPAASARADAVSAIEWQYYAAMTVPLGVDVVITLIYAWVNHLPQIIFVNVATDVLVLLVGGHFGARHLFRPIRQFLRTGTDFSAVERSLTQLPLRSATWIMWLYFALLAYRLVLPLLFNIAPPEVPQPTWLDAIITLLVQTIFIFVMIYFLVSTHLEQLCRLLFERYGVNLGLFYGRFALKIGVALGFTSVAPLALIAGEIFSYTGDRLVREAAVDLLASAFGLAVVLYWVSRSLTRPIARLDLGMGKVAKGDLGVQLPVTSNEEIGELTSRFNRMVEGLRERQHIRETFGKYVSESVASALLQQTGDGRLSGETREATLMFTDIAGFTTMSEQLQPDTLIALLNDYLEVVMAPIERHGGVVNSFIGDGLFASFNMPLPNADHAGCAIKAAVEIQQALQGRTFAGGIRLATRIGINTGTVIGGTIGAGGRLSYTLLGDAVNTAARLQELNKVHGTQILVTNSTRSLAADRFRFRPIGEVPIRGRTGALLVHTLDPH